MDFAIDLAIFTKALPMDQRTDGPTDQRTDGPTDRRTDIPSYRDAIAASKNVTKVILVASYTLPTMKNGKFKAIPHYY